MFAAVRGPPVSSPTSAPSQPPNGPLLPQGHLQPPWQTQQGALQPQDTAEDQYAHLHENAPWNECLQELKDYVQFSLLTAPSNSVLGTGDYSSVRLGYTSTHQQVAVKEFDPAGLSDEELLANVKREGQLQLKCSRIKTGQGSEPFPHVPQVHCWQQLGGSYCLVMESCCCSLGAAMPHPDATGAPGIPPRPTTGQRWSAAPLRHYTGLARLRTRLQVLRDVAAAVKHLHEHCAVLHNDLRADNVLLDVRNGELVVKVSDFGLAEDVRPDGSHLQPPWLDTQIPQPTNALWVAPEVHWGRAVGPFPVNTSTDVFAFGHVMWEVLSGSEPYERIPGHTMCPKAVKGAFRTCQLTTENCDVTPMRLPDELPLHCPEWGAQYPTGLKALFDSCCSFTTAVDPVSYSSLTLGQQQGRPIARRIHQELQQVEAAAAAAEHALPAAAAAVASAAAAVVEEPPSPFDVAAAASPLTPAAATAAAVGQASQAAAAAAVASPAAFVAEPPSPFAVAAASPLAPPAAATAAAAVERASQAAAAAVASAAAVMAEPPSPFDVAAASPPPAAAADSSAAA